MQGLRLSRANGRERPRLASGLTGVLVALLLAAPLPAAAYPVPGRTTLVSVSSEGVQGTPGTYAPRISPDGRFVAFMSAARNLDPADTNAFFDVYLRDRLLGTTELISVAPDGTVGDYISAGGTVSADGRYVAFQSFSSNLVPGDTNGTSDTFVRDRVTGLTERVNLSPSGEEANLGSSYYPAMSPDGRYVAFSSVSSNLVPGDSNNAADVFVLDRKTGETELASVTSGGAQVPGARDIFTVAISDDGRVVTFDHPTPLVPEDTNGTADVYAHDRETGETTLVSVNLDGTAGARASQEPEISADGRFVVFQSSSADLVPADTNGFVDTKVRFDIISGLSDIFVHDLETGVTERVSVTSAGEESNGTAWLPDISDDGRMVAFASRASNLVPGDTNGDNPTLIGFDVFVHDRVTKTTERASVGSNGEEGDLGSTLPSLTADGSEVAFQGLASTLAPDTNNDADVFVRHRGPSVGIGEIEVGSSGDGISVSGWARLLGAPMATATDPGDDGDARVGAELVSGSVLYRPEEEDLLVRLGAAGLPRAANPPTHTLVPSASVAGAPGVLYGLAFEHEGVGYEVRATRTGEPSFILYRCEPVCLATTPLAGGYATTGSEIRMAVPLSALGAEEGSSLGALRAFAALGDPAAPPLDEIALGESTIPGGTVRLGVAQEGTSEDEVAFETTAELVAGTFTATVPSPAAEGPFRLWARACVGGECHASSVPV